MKKEYSVVITPAISPGQRHILEQAVELLGYKVTDGETDVDGRSCNFNFEKEEEVNS
jgi:hypothetical protein